MTMLTTQQPAQRTAPSQGHARPDRGRFFFASRYEIDTNRTVVVESKSRVWLALAGRPGAVPLPQRSPGVAHGVAATPGKPRATRAAQPQASDAGMVEQVIFMLMVILCIKN